jgi:hypothetical protein
MHRRSHEKYLSSEEARVVSEEILSMIRHLPEIILSQKNPEKF